MSKITLAHTHSSACAVYTHSHRVLHVSHGTLELAKVQLRAVEQGKVEVATRPPSVEDGRLAVLTVSEHAGVVAPRRDTLKGSEGDLLQLADSNAHSNRLETS